MTEQGIGVLLCHGFTGSLAETRDLGEWLKKSGLIVSTVCLPGHGSTPEELETTSGHDWYRHLEQAYRDLKSKSSQVFLIGISLGGLLSLKLAAAYPEIAGVVTEGTPLVLADPLARRWIIQLGRLFMRYSPTDVKKGQEGYYYDRRPLRSIIELMNVRDEVLSLLSRVKCPVLVMHSQLDATAKFEGAELLMKKLGSKHKYLRVVDIPEHVFLTPYNNPHHQKEWEIIQSFLINPIENPII